MRASRTARAVTLTRGKISASPMGPGIVANAAERPAASGGFSFQWMRHEGGLSADSWRHAAFETPHSHYVGAGGWTHNGSRRARVNCRTGSSCEIMPTNCGIAINACCQSKQKNISRPRRGEARRDTSGDAEMGKYQRNRGAVRASAEPNKGKRHAVCSRSRRAVAIAHRFRVAL